MTIQADQPQHRAAVTDELLGQRPVWGSFIGGSFVDPGGRAADPGVRGGQRAPARPARHRGRRHGRPGRDGLEGRLRGRLA
jgi:hypothetical protein